MPGGAINITIGGNAQQLTQAAAQAANALSGFGNAATAAGNSADHAFDEIAAGAAAMARIEAAINAAAAAALNAGHSFDSLESNVISTITPLNTLEARLQDIREAIGRSATVQGAANLGAQYEVLNRNLAETRARVEVATQAAVGLSRAFNTVASATSATGAAMNRLAPATRPVLTNLTVIPPAANAAAASLARMRAQTGAGGAALTDFSRVIQDAPFGIIGIGNNITQLSESFGRLRATSGSTGAAFRQLFTSAGGFGGIGLAISAITTALTFANVGFGAWTRGLTGSKKAADEAAKATEDLLKTIKSVSLVAGEAVGGTQGQVAQVRALANIIIDSSKAYDIRKRALQELQQVNKSYFGDLKLEDATTGKLTEKVNEYTKALVSQAIVKGYTDEIGRLSKELFEQQQILDRLRLKKQQTDAALAKTPQFRTIRGEDQLTDAFIDATLASEEATKAFNKQKDAVFKLAESRALYNGVLQQANEEALKFADLSNNTVSSTKKEDEILKALRKEMSGYERQLKDINELRKAGALPISQENDALALQLKIFDTLGKIDAREVAIGIKPDLEINPKVLDLQIDEALKEAAIRASAGAKAIKIPFLTRFTFSDKSSANLFSPADLLGANTFPTDPLGGVVKAIQENAAIRLAELRKNLGESLRETLRLGIIEGLSGAAEALGTAVAGIFSGESVGRVLATAGEGILKIVGGVLQDMGKQIILASALVQSLKKALSTLFANPAASLAVGVGLVALGSVLKSIKLSGGVTPGFADGGIVPGAQILVGERGPEIATLPAGSSITPLSPFQETRQPLPSLFARGDDLYLVYNRTAGRRRRM